MRVDQSAFTDAMLNPDHDVPDGLVDPEGRSAGKRFNVYRNNVAVSLTEALITAFPSLYRILGDDNFRLLSGVYLRQHPPSSPLIMFYGEEMPVFLAGFKPVKQIEYLPDLARIDLARRRSYHAADAAAISPKKLQDLSPEMLMQAHFTIAPATHVLSSPWPIFSLWRAAMEGGSQPDTRPEEILIARPELDPVVILLPTGGARFIEALRDGESFGQAAENAAEATDNFDLTSTLSAMLSGGVITGLTQGDDG